MFCRPTNGFSCNDFCCCCSLAVWTNSTLWSTTTPTQTSTWWKTWAAWTGWVSPCPVSDYLSQPTVLKEPGIEPPEDSSPQQFPKHKMPLSVCQRRGAVSRNMVIRRLETFPAGLGLLFLFPCFLSHFVGSPSLPPFTDLLPLCCTIIPVKPGVEQWEKTIHCSQRVFLLAFVTAAKLIGAER